MSWRSILRGVFSFNGTNDIPMLTSYLSKNPTFKKIVLKVNQAITLYPEYIKLASNTSKTKKLPSYKKKSPSKSPKP